MPINPPDHISMLIQRAIGNHIVLGGAADEAQMMYPGLWRWLTNTDAGPEHIMEPAKVSVRAVPDGWHIALTSDALGCSLDATASALADAFKALEEVLKQVSPPFRYWPGHTPKIRRIQPKRP